MTNLNIINSFEIENEKFFFYDISKVFFTNNKLKKLPIVLKILLEANLRKSKNQEEFNNIIKIFENRKSEKITFSPSRLILENFEELPIFIDLAVLREKANDLAFNINNINPQILVDLIIDNSLLKESKEFVKEKNLDLIKDKYHFIKWASLNFTNLRIIPPGSRVCNLINLEYLSTILHIEKIDNKFFLYPETILSLDTNSTMFNTLGVLGTTIDCVESQLAILGLDIKKNLPKVIGVNVYEKPNLGLSSSDLINHLIEKLKISNLDGQIVEFYGKGLKYLTLEDRSIILSKTAEFNASSAYFAIDDKTIKYFNSTRENKDYGKLVKTYLKKQELFYSDEKLDYDEIVDIDLSLISPYKNYINNFTLLKKGDYLKDGDIVLSSIFASKTTFYYLIHSLLLAKKAIDFGLKINNNIKAKFVIENSVIKEYLQDLDLLKYVKELGFEIVYNNYILNSDEIKENIKKDILRNNLNVFAISSLDKDYIKKDIDLVKSTYIFSPSFVIFLSLIGTTKFDFENGVIKVIDNRLISFKDIWPNNDEFISYLRKIDSTLYKKIYKDIYKGDKFWENLEVNFNSTYNWNLNSTYIQATTIDDEIKSNDIKIEEGEILMLLGDNITTEQILPSKNISLYSSAAKYLEKKGVKSFEYDSFENRCGNEEIMIRNLFDTTELKNMMVSKEGGFTIDYDNNEIVPVFEKALRLKNKKIPSIIFAGQEFGKGKTKYWAIRALKIIGVKTIIAKSFDEKYRQNLINFGILPLEFIDDDITSLKLKGDEKVTIIKKGINYRSIIKTNIQKSGVDISIELRCRIDNFEELNYFKQGGVLNSLFNNIINESL